MSREHARARVTVARIRPAFSEADRYVEQDEVAAAIIEDARQFARRVAHWQLRAELAVVTLAGLIALPAIVEALQVWWRS